MKNARRRKVKPKPKIELQTLANPVRLPVWGRRVWTAFFLLVLLFSIGLKIYKADYTGLVYDEVLTFQDYGHSLEEAVGKFKSTNNHVLNSVFVSFGYNLFGSYIHFVRIFSLTAGILFSCALAYVIYKTIQSNVLRIAALAWISFIPYLFDYSFYARGYAYMLAALMMQFALILFLLDHKIRLRYFWAPVLAFGLLNFMSLGAILSSVLVVMVMNLVFVLFYSPKIFRDVPKPWQPIVVTGVPIALVTLLMLSLLFHKIYDKILDNPIFKEISGGWYGWPSFVFIFRRVFLTQVFKGPLSWEKYGLGVALISLGITTGVCLYSIVRAVRTCAPKPVLSRRRIGNLLLLAAAWGWLILIYQGVFRDKNLSAGDYKMILVFLIFFSAAGLAWHTYFQAHSAKNLIPIVTGWAWLIVIFYGAVLYKSLGLARNNIYFIPFMILSGAILVDRILGRIPKFALRQALTGMCFFVVLAFLARNPVSPHYSFSPGASISRPLLRRLREIDPMKRWRIAFHIERKSWPLPFRYYGYHTKFYTHYYIDRYSVIPYARGDVEIYPLDKVPPNATLLDREYFAKANCAVVIQPRPLPKPKPLPRRPPNSRKKPPS